MSYAIALHEIKTLACLAAQLDHVKNFLPAGCEALRESVVLIQQAHTVLEMVLGADVALVYSPDPEEQTA